MEKLIGEQMFNWACELFPYNRSLTGNGVRKTLQFIKSQLPELKIFEVPSGTKAFDWTIPREWAIDDAWIADLRGHKLIDVRNSNLHVVGYSKPIDRIMTRDELDVHLHSLPDQPEAIPYITSYYKEDFGFCLTQTQRDSLGEGPFHVYINSKLFDGNMTYAELFFPGESAEEIFFSTYVCHPSMANNELSGPIVATALAKHIKSLQVRRYSYRFLFTVENIGATYYISRNLNQMKKNVKAGWVLTCIGDNRTYSYLPTRTGNTLTDSVSRRVLLDLKEEFTEFSWLDGGSDERRYNSPGVALPIASFMRSMYGRYPEYHTSLDNLDLISPEGLQGGLQMLVNAIQILETNFNWKMTTICEPQLGRRGMYPTTSTKRSSEIVRNLLNVISYLDGTIDLLGIAEKCLMSYQEVIEIVEKLKLHGLVERT